MQRLPNSVGSILAAWFVLATTEHHFHLLNGLDGFRHQQTQFAPDFVVDHQIPFASTAWMALGIILLKSIPTRSIWYCLHWLEQSQDQHLPLALAPYSLLGSRHLLQLYTLLWFLADSSGSGSCTPGFFTLVSLIFSTCSLALCRLKYKTPLTMNMPVDSVTLV